MKCPSEICKWCCPECDSEQDFEWETKFHLKCSDCGHIGLETLFVDIVDEIPEHILKNMKRIKK